MDHLPWSYDVNLPRPNTPYLLAGYEHYICDDVELLEHWPGWRKWSMGAQTPIEELARQCQGWLFFGFIHAMTMSLGESFELEDYIDQSNLSLIDSTKISHLINGLRSRKSAKVAVFDRGRKRLAAYFLVTLAVRTVHLCRHWVAQALSRLEEPSGFLDPRSSNLFNVFWSMIMLLEFIVEQLSLKGTYNTKLGIYESCMLNSIQLSELPQWTYGRKVDRMNLTRVWDAELDFDGIENDDTTTELPLPRRSCHIQQGLKLLGRCPTLLERTDPSPLEVYRLTAIPYVSGVSHNECMGRNCEAFNTTEDTYQLRHIDSCAEGSSCSLVHIDYDYLLQLLQQGCPAIVRSRLSKHGDLDLKIIDGSNVSKATAISHVWAGGLGNFQENAHYRCRLRQVHQDVYRSQAHAFKLSTVYYWLDTLCIPAREGPLKTKAISAIASSYARCASVLVIDPELTALSTDSVCNRQIRLAILNSPWMARSWTLPEAALSRVLKFAFANAVISLHDIDVDRKLAEMTMFESLWRIDVSAWREEKVSELFWILSDYRDEFGDGPRLPDPPLQPNMEFVTFWNQLCKRNSTKTEDLPLILAVFLGCSAGELLELSREKRMHALLRSQPELPSSLLFAPIDPQTKDWCPVFPTCGGPPSTLSANASSMAFTDEGFLAITEARNILLLQTKGLLTMNGQIRLRNKWGDRCLEVRFLKPPAASADLGESVLFVLSLFEVQPHDPERYYDGLCFTVVKDDTRCLRGRFATACHWRLASVDLDAVSEDTRSSRSSKNDHYHLVSYERESE